MGEFSNVTPDEWKNIPLPLVHATKATMLEIEKVNLYL